ncbi:MAG: diaminopimelate decarboxylase [Chloroflexi bacterium]|nr:diaminopimelate decarboxylase [Chloroflexota bacterium]
MRRYDDKVNTPRAIRFYRPIWPISAYIHRERLHLRGFDVAGLAARLGTPLYLYDGATFDHAVAAYRAGLRAWPGPSAISYAAKAWFNRPFARVLARRGLHIDAVSEGELGVALAAGFPAGRIHVHGNNKSPTLARMAARAGVAAWVVDHPQELALLARLSDEGERIPDLWLRFTPALSAPTHPYRQTGHRESKFGMSRDEILLAAEQIHKHPKLRLTGLHAHIGSQIFDLDPMFEACDRLIALFAELRERGHASLRVLSPGGGLGAPYHPDDPRLSLFQNVERIVRHCAATWARMAKAPHPTLLLEPGRSLIARAGLALYTVGAVRMLENGRRIIAVDGGMADNVRPALYRARYTACAAAAALAQPLGPARIVGPLCESGDFLIDKIDLPPLSVGDILAIPMSGAYHLSMASNYNGALRPAVYWLHRDDLIPFQRRETIADLLARDLPLPLIAL